MTSTDSLSAFQRNCLTGLTSGRRDVLGRDGRPRSPGRELPRGRPPVGRTRRRAVLRHRHVRGVVEPRAVRRRPLRPIRRLRRQLERAFARAREEGFGSEVKRRILLGTYALSAGYHDKYYAKAQDARAWVKQDFDEAFEDVDVVASPTMPVPPFELGESLDDPLQMYLADANTVPVNLANLPAISVPAGETDGLPVGLQLVGPAFGERQLLRAGSAPCGRTPVSRSAPSRWPEAGAEPSVTSYSSGSTSLRRSSRSSPRVYWFPSPLDVPDVNAVAVAVAYVRRSALQASAAGRVRHRDAVLDDGVRYRAAVAVILVGTPPSSPFAILRLPDDAASRRGVPRHPRHPLPSPSMRCGRRYGARNRRPSPRASGSVSTDGRHGDTRRDGYRRRSAQQLRRQPARRADAVRDHGARRPARRRGTRRRHRPRTGPPQDGDASS